MNEWLSLEDHEPCIGWLCDVLLDNGEIIHNVEAEEIEDDGFLPYIGFRDYLKNATHFRKV